jgi:nickel/cobalt exporter
MTEFSTLLQTGAANAWLFIPSAIFLGALHGLEPGHSKTMMAAFIIAVRGTVTQAVLLGLAATLSHTAVVWVIALGGMYFGQQWNAEASEPYLQIASAVLIVGTASWMIWRTVRQERSCFHDHHEHGHSHDEVKRIDTGHGVVRWKFSRTGVPRFRLRHDGKRGHAWAADQIRIETERPDGHRQTFSFVQRDDFLESEQESPSPMSSSHACTWGTGITATTTTSSLPNTTITPSRTTQGWMFRPPATRIRMNWLTRTTSATASPTGM